MIQFILNGSRVSYDGCAADCLLDVLRDQFGCRSVKCSCKEGECGACSVLMDGVLVRFSAWKGIATPHVLPR